MGAQSHLKVGVQSPMGRLSSSNGHRQIMVIFLKMQINIYITYINFIIASINYRGCQRVSSNTCAYKISRLIIIIKFLDIYIHNSINKCPTYYCLVLPMTYLKSSHSCCSTKPKLRFYLNCVESYNSLFSLLFTTIVFHFLPCNSVKFLELLYFLGFVFNQAVQEFFTPFRIIKALMRLIDDCDKEMSFLIQYIHTSPKGSKDRVAEEAGVEASNREATSNRSHSIITKFWHISYLL